MLDGILGKQITAAHICAAAILYCIAHGLVTLAAGPALALDDVKLNVVTQSFQWGYQPENPPLFEWLLILVQQFVGPTLASFVITKYIFLTAAAVFVFLAAKEALGDRRWAALTALSLSLCFQVGWNYHQAFTHSAALVPTVAFLWWALLRLLRTRRLLDFAILGLAIGAGLLAKYSFAAALALALVAAATNAETRRAIFRPALLVSLAVALIVLWPHLSWVITQNGQLAAHAAERLQGHEASYWGRIAKGVPRAFWASISFAAPFILVALAAGGRDLFHWRALPPGAALARRATIIGVAAPPLSVLLFGLGHMQERYALAILFPATFWFAGELMALSGEARERRIVVFSCLGLMAAAFSIRIAEVAFPGAPLCKECRQWAPYGALKEALDTEGFENGTLVGFEDTTAGNLRRLYPHARMLSAHMPFYTAPGGAIGDKCYFIWSEDLGPRPPAHILEAIKSAHVIDVDAEWARVMRGEARRRTRWTIAEMSGAPRLAQRLCRFSAQDN